MTGARRLALLFRAALHRWRADRRAKTGIVLLERAKAHRRRADELELEADKLHRQQLDEIECRRRQ